MNLLNNDVLAAFTPTKFNLRATHGMKVAESSIFNIPLCTPLYLPGILTPL